MNEFYAYIYSLAVAVTAAGVVTALAPESGQLKKHVKYIAALCVLLMLLLPAKNAIMGLAGAFGEAMTPLAVTADKQTDDNLRQIVLSKTAENIEASIKSLLALKLGCDERGIAVTVALSSIGDDSVVITGVTAAIPKDYTAIGLEFYISEQTGCAARNVVIEWKS